MGGIGLQDDVRILAVQLPLFVRSKHRFFRPVEDDRRIPKVERTDANPADAIFRLANGRASPRTGSGVDRCGPRTKRTDPRHPMRWAGTRNTCFATRSGPATTDGPTDAWAGYPRYQLNPALRWRGMANIRRDDRVHWNQRYTERPWPDEPSPWLVANAELLPEPESALDVAGGTGRNAVWLASRGWDVTIVDVSDVALAMATNRAEMRHAALSTHLTDLSTDPLPEGPWDLIVLFHYLDRAILPALTAALRPGGVLIGALATVSNLERNPRPPLAYVLEDGELPALMGELELIRYEEGWQDDHHDARFVARRPL